MKKTELINGSFSKEDALELVTGIITLKINHHEKMIHRTANEEDIKMRENRIRKLQADLAAFREELSQKEEPVSLAASLLIED